MAFAGQKCSIQDSGGNITDPEVHLVRNAGPNGISVDPEKIATGRNSGYQAINLAILAGAKTVLLIGYDGTTDHWFGKHPVPTPESAGPMYVEAARAGAPAIKAAGVRVINCSPGSAINAFERMDLAEALRL